jgi:uncharacterized protein (UPF0128 family)
MNNSCDVFWKKKLVGRVYDLSNDMWYYDGHWICHDSPHAREFETILQNLDPRHVRQFPENSLLVQMKFDQPFSFTYMLALGLEGDDLLLRMATPELAAYVDLDQFPPWQKTDNGEFFEAELKKEMTFFHPLKRKKLKAIGIRTDRDDVLFKLMDGSGRYAVVHLTYNKENSRTFPSTKFYENWEELYQNEIANYAVIFDVEAIKASIIEELEKQDAKYELNSFDSGAVMIDVYWKDKLYVIQMHGAQLGFSLVTEDSGFSSVPDESFTEPALFLQKVKGIFL